MSLEIERKFLVKNNSFKEKSHQKLYIKQGFLNSDKNRVVRVRIADAKAFLTIKGKSNKSGTTRFEWEKEISVSEAGELFNLCEPNIIEKYRFLITCGSHTFEVDEFLGENQGLIIAEIELLNENEVFDIPSWVGKEVTGQEKYYNSNISKFPFKNWK
ncbi:MAG: CYTH domain-containing protein [Flavobacteriaceae bacterium]